MYIALDVTKDVGKKTKKELVCSLLALADKIQKKLDTTFKSPPDFYIKLQNGKPYLPGKMVSWTFEDVFYGDGNRDFNGAKALINKTITKVMRKRKEGKFFLKGSLPFDLEASRNVIEDIDSQFITKRSKIKKIK